MSAATDHAPVLGIDFGGTKVAVRVEGGSIPPTTRRLTIDAGERAQDVITRALACAQELADEASGVDAVGVATPGVVYEDRIELAPNVPGWGGLALAESIQSRFGTALVAIENDVKAAAAAEVADGALHGVPTGLYVNLGTGIALALVVAGAVVRGAHGAAGEIGYARPHGSGSATLEEHAGGGGLSQRLRMMPGLPADTVAELVARAPHDASARAIWTDAVESIGRCLCTAALTVDPAQIVLGGGMVRAGTALTEPLTAQLRRTLPYPPRLSISRFAADASLHGALAIARLALKDTA